MQIRSVIKELEIIFSNYKFYNPDDLKNNVLNYIKFKLNGLSLEESLELLSKISKSTNYHIQNIYWLDDKWINENKIELLSFINIRKENHFFQVVDEFSIDLNII